VYWGLNSGLHACYIGAPPPGISPVLFALLFGERVSLFCPASLGGDPPIMFPIVAGMAGMHHHAHFYPLR
jgi:hypothetical protein